MTEPAGHPFHPSVCGVATAPGTTCSAPVASDAPVNLCAHHLAVAHEWVDREVGITDVLPSPCLACGSRLGVHYPSGWLCAICEWKVGDIADYEISAVRVDVVYYIRFGDRIKIGTSASPRSRLAALGNNELLAFERGTRELEQRRHRQFAAYRFARTEWFEQSDEILRHINTLNPAHEDPWNLYKLWISQKVALQS
jgi:hypothetical protein